MDEDDAVDAREIPFTNAGSKRFPDYGWAYYSTLLARWESLAPPTERVKIQLADRLRNRVLEIESRKKKWLSWNDLATIELLLLEIEPDEDLRASAWALREQYRNIAGPAAYAAYEAAKSLPSAKVPPAVEVPPEQLRAELRGLLGQLHLHYDLTTRSENLRAHLSRWAATWAAVLLGIGLLLMVSDFIIFPRQAVEGADQSTAPSTNSETSAATTSAKSAKKPTSTSGSGKTSGKSIPSSTDNTASKTGAGGAITTTSGAAGAPQSETRLTTPSPGWPASNKQGNAHGPIAWLGRKLEALRQDLTTFAPLIIYIMLMGAVGGFVSLRSRMQQATSDGDLLTNVITLEHGRKAMMLAPIQGSVFAVLLFLLFAGGAISGTFFPKINRIPAGVVDKTKVSQPGPHGITFRKFLDTASPVGMEDMALVLVWSFLAGFAERLVPDALDRLVRNPGSGEKGGKPTKILGG